MRESAGDASIREGNYQQAYLQYAENNFQENRRKFDAFARRSLRLSAADRSESTLTRSLASSLTCEICGLVMRLKSIPEQLIRTADRRFFYKTT